MTALLENGRPRVWAPAAWHCAACEGTGKLHPNCEPCDGLGWVAKETGPGSTECPECGGEKCPDCGGSGELP